MKPSSGAIALLLICLCPSALMAGDDWRLLCPRAGGTVDSSVCAEDHRCEAAVAAALVYQSVGAGDGDLAICAFDEVGRQQRSVDWQQYLPSALPESYRQYLLNLADAQGFGARVYYFDRVRVLAFKGSDSIVDREDWVLNNLPQLIGVVPFQYSLAQQLRWHLEGMPDTRARPTVLAGHSLGGGLATYASLGAPGEVWTFNPARLHSLAGARRPGHSPEGLSITNIIVTGDFVSAMGLRHAIGRDVFVPFVPVNLPDRIPLVQLWARHSMDAVLRGMNEPHRQSPQIDSAPFVPRIVQKAQDTLARALLMLIGVGVVMKVGLAVPKAAASMLATYIKSKPIHIQFLWITILPLTAIPFGMHILGLMVSSEWLSFTGSGIWFAALVTAGFAWKAISESRWVQALPVLFLLVVLSAIAAPAAGLP